MNRDFKIKSTLILLNLLKKINPELFVVICDFENPDSNDVTIDDDNVNDIVVAFIEKLEKSPLLKNMVGYIVYPEENEETVMYRGLFIFKKGLEEDAISELEKIMSKDAIGLLNKIAKSILNEAILIGEIWEKEFSSSYSANLLEHRLTLDNEKNLKSIKEFLKHCYVADDEGYVNNDLVIRKFLM